MIRRTSHGKRDPHVPIVTPWAWPCPKKSGTIAKERCRKIQDDDGCLCENAWKAPSDEEMRQARETTSEIKRSPLQKRNHKIPEGMILCTFSQSKWASSYYEECPNGFSLWNRKEKGFKCVYMRKMKELFNLSVCLFREEG